MALKNLIVDMPLKVSSEEVSANNYTITDQSSPVFTGNYYDFNGNSSLLLLPNNINFGGVLTFSSWIYIDSFASDPFTIFSKRGNTTSSVRPLVYEVGTNGIAFFYLQNSSSQYTRGFITPTFSTGQWYHIVTTYDSANTSLLFYVDGKLVPSTYTDQNWGDMWNTSVDTHLGGRNANSGERYSDGKLLNFKVWQDIATPQEVQDLYKKELKDIQPSNPVEGLVYNLPLLNDNKDVSGNGYDGTDESDPSYDGEYTTFDGNDGINYGVAGLNNGGAFSMSGWVYVTDDTPDEGSIMEYYSADGGSGRDLVLIGGSRGTYKYRFLVRNENSNQYNFTGGTSTENVWVHQCMTYDGTTVRSYVDGVEVDSAAFTYSNPTQTPLELTVGITSAGARFLIGRLKYIKYWNRAITPFEVQYLYQNEN